MSETLEPVLSGSGSGYGFGFGCGSGKWCLCSIREEDVSARETAQDKTRDKPRVHVRHCVRVTIASAN